MAISIHGTAFTYLDHDLLNDHTLESNQEFNEKVQRLLDITRRNCAMKIELKRQQAMLADSCSEPDAMGRLLCPLCRELRMHIFLVCKGVISLFS